MIIYKMKYFVVLVVAIFQVHNAFSEMDCPVEESEGQIAVYEEILNLKNTPEKLLIDVRAPYLLDEFGRIPNAINIPLNKLADTLQNTPSEEFEAMYGRVKPTMETELIFSCHEGTYAKNQWRWHCKCVIKIHDTTRAAG